MFLEALRHAIRNKHMNIDEDLTIAEWREFFRMASIHGVLPLIINSVYQSKALKEHESFRDHMIKRKRQKSQGTDQILVFQEKPYMESKFLYHKTKRWMLQVAYFQRTQQYFIF